MWQQALKDFGSYGPVAALFVLASGGATLKLLLYEIVWFSFADVFETTASRFQTIFTFE